MKHISHTELIHNHMTIPWHHLCQENIHQSAKHPYPKKLPSSDARGLCCFPAAQEPGEFEAL